MIPTPEELARMSDRDVARAYIDALIDHDDAAVAVLDREVDARIGPRTSAAFFELAGDWILARKEREAANGTAMGQGALPDEDRADGTAAREPRARRRHRAAVRG